MLTYVGAAPYVGGVHEQRSEAISLPREEIASPQKARLAMTMGYGIGYLSTDFAAALSPPVVDWLSPLFLSILARGG
jgi:hypothetical protein